MKNPLFPSSAVAWTLLCAASLLSGLATAAADPAAADVLNLKEASQLLRVPPRIVTKLARAGTIPARRIGSDWRFNRVALMEWLQGDRHAYPAVPRKAAQIAAGNAAAKNPAAPLAQEQPAPALGSGLTIAELGSIRGAGRDDPLRLAQAAASPVPAAGPELRQPIGERPTGPTAEETALRQQGISLLQGGAKTVEFGLAYSRQVRELAQLGIRDESNTTTATLTGRYGLADDLQLTARVPYQYRRQRTLSSLTTETNASSDRTTDAFAGDLSLNLVGVALQENVGRPTLIWSLDTVLPTGPGDVGLGAGLVVSKSYDPVVLFAGASYLHGIRTEPDDTRRSLAKHSLGFNFGYAYAVNDSIALSGLFAGSYRTGGESTPDGLPPPERESYLIQLGVTWQLGRGLFIDPAIAFGVGGNSPDMTFSTNLIYSF